MFWRRPECCHYRRWEANNYPTAAARPTLLCIGMPERLMTILVRMPPPTPANPDTAPIRNPKSLDQRRPADAENWAESAPERRIVRPRAG